MTMKKKMRVKLTKNWAVFGEVKTLTTGAIRIRLTRFCLISHAFKNPDRIPMHRPVGIRHSPHTHSIPIPVGFPTGIPIYPRQPCHLSFGGCGLPKIVGN